LNVYAFVRGNPILLVDHSGLCGKLRDVKKVLKPGLTRRRGADIIPRSEPPKKSVGIGPLKKDVYFSYQKQTEVGFAGGLKKSAADLLAPASTSHTDAVNQWKETHEDTLSQEVRENLKSGDRWETVATVIGFAKALPPLAPAASALGVAKRGAHGVAAHRKLKAAKQEEASGETTATTAHAGMLRSQGRSQLNKAIPLPFLDTVTGQGAREKTAAAQIDISAHGRSGGAFTRFRGSGSNLRETQGSYAASEMSEKDRARATKKIYAKSPRTRKLLNIPVRRSHRGEN
jgi:hypothetical protein